MNPTMKSVTAIIAGVVLLPLLVISLLLSWYITPEGHLDVVKRFGKAVSVSEPGLNFKIPLVDSTTTIEVRTRKNVETMGGATLEQMPVSITASMNWTANKTDILRLFVDYGSLEQFESRVIDPKFRALIKESVAKFKAEDTIGKRDLVTTKARDAIDTSFKTYPIKISAINLEDISLPVNYLKSIETKQTEKNLADAEEFKLAKQKLIALQEVNTADAQKQAAMQIADGKAYSIETVSKAEARKVTLLGQAEAEAITAKAKALKSNPLIIELEKVKQWKGQVPTTVMGEGQGVLMDMRAK